MSDTESGEIVKSAAPETTGQENPWDKLEVLSEQKAGQPEARKEEKAPTEGAKQEATTEKVDPKATDSPPVKDHIQERFGELTRKSKEAAERAERAEKEAKELRERLDALEKSNKPKLKRENYLTDEEYHSALVKEQVDKIRAEDSAKQAEETARTQREQAEEARRSEEWGAKVQSALKPEEAGELSQSIRQAQSEGVQLRPEIIEWVQHSDVGPKILLELLRGRHNPVVQALSTMPALMLAQRLGAFENAIRASVSAATTTGTQAAKPVSAAPAPVGSVGAGKGAAKPSLSDAEWNAQQIKKRTRR